MASLQESLNRFKKQQEKCQSTLTSIAAKTSSKPAATPKGTPYIAPPAVSAKSPAPAVKFSNDTERLQHINSIRKAPVGAQIKRVIHLLFETRQAFTPEQINEACHVDVNGNKTVFDSLRNNPKVSYDGKRFAYKSKHALKDKSQLLVLIRKFPEGIAVIDLKDAYPTVMEDLQDDPLDMLKPLGGRHEPGYTWHVYAMYDEFFESYGSNLAAFELRFTGGHSLPKRPPSTHKSRR